MEQSISPKKEIDVVKPQPLNEEEKGLLSAMVTQEKVKQPIKKRLKKGQTSIISIKINTQTTAKSDLALANDKQDLNQLIEKKVEPNSGSYASGSLQPNELGFAAPEAQDQEDLTKHSKSDN